MPSSLLSSFSANARHGHVSLWLICFCLSKPLFSFISLRFCVSLLSNTHRTNVSAQMFVCDLWFHLILSSLTRKTKSQFGNTCASFIPTYKTMTMAYELQFSKIHKLKSGICSTFCIISSFEM